jgi:hypothetical protein
MHRQELSGLTTYNGHAGILDVPPHSACSLSDVSD